MEDMKNSSLFAAVFHRFISQPASSRSSALLFLAVISALSFLGELCGYTVYFSDPAKAILKHFSQCSDIVLFIQSAISHSSYELKYTLHPPYTTSKLDCDYILQKLASIKLLEDFYFSSMSSSYRISLNPSSEYDINDILSSGLYSLLKKTDITDIAFNSCIKLKMANTFLLM